METRSIRPIERTESSSPSSILVVGTGAVGSFYGGKLAQAGALVSVVCRSDYEAVKAQGIEISSPWGDFSFRPQNVFREVREAASFPDYVLVALKALPEADTAKIIEPAVGPETAIVLLQNGIEIEQVVQNTFPRNELLSGLAFICVSRVEPGRVQHQDYGRLTIGKFPSGVTDKARVLGALFESAGVPCEVTEDVVAARWKKLVWNAPFNPISVLGQGASTRDILGIEESRHLVRYVMEEVCRIAKATGHELPISVIEKNIVDTQAMEPYKTSMLLDFEAKRPMEVEAILGNAIRVAKRLKLSVPHLETLYALLKLADQQNR